MSQPFELVVVAAHGPEYIGACRDSLERVGVEDVLVIDTGSGTVPAADVLLPAGHPTGAYRWAYQNRLAERYLFIQDSMVALSDPLPWFRERFAGSGAVAWGRFPMQWDTDEQRRAVGDRYASRPSHGIFGPIFYTDRASLDELGRLDLFPHVPADRLEAQGTERAWAYAFADAGLPVVGPEWNADAMQHGFGPFRKTFAGRP